MKPVLARQTRVNLEISPVNVNEYVRLTAIRRGIPLYQAVNDLLKAAMASETRREKRQRAEIPAQREVPPAATGG